MLRIVSHIQNMEPSVKHTADLAAIASVGLTIADWLPALAALVSAVWMVLRIYEHIRWVRRGRRQDEKP